MSYKIRNVFQYLILKRDKNFIKIKIVDDVITPGQEIAHSYQQKLSTETARKRSLSNLLHVSLLIQYHFFVTNALSDILKDYA